MCGFVGVFHLDGEREVTREEIARMTHNHRASGSRR